MDIKKLNIIYNNTKSNISESSREKKEDSDKIYYSSTQNNLSDDLKDGEANALFSSYLENSEITTTSTIEWLSTWRPLSD
jgi:hypothetical protein